jgi:hypothetical protein
MEVYTTHDRIGLIGEIKYVTILGELCTVVEISDHIYIREVNGVLYLDKIFSLQRVDDKIIKQFGLDKHLKSGLIEKTTIQPKPLK